ncbi:hypothetical protein [Tenacibaculum finnmarkense]|uniref:hypothetical protein n=1 Tax=Tenacibaculum finnmarkense TaxID=2781243 RepID=UPI001E4EDD7B|nr:hypothetical protein [Tenacibaculum finnmarkense]MCD8401409.1 hypothetical protein [Tenacibaculum finnmarkense genomovar ulcerans]
MAVIIDANCIANVFSKSSAKHSEFEPIFEWIVRGKGIMIIGGTKYQSELIKLKKYFTILRYLKEVGKVYSGDKDEIDKYQLIVEKLRDNKDFDDPHLPAIIVNTKCRIICSEDTRSIPYVTDTKYYPKGIKTPVYYTSSRNKKILCDNYVDDSLKPLCRINKKYADKLSRLIE